MKRRAFTLIELIITVTIFTIIIVTVYSSFYMGMKAWRRAEGDASFPKIRIGLLKIEKELKDSFYFSRIPFKGTSEEVSFPLTVPDGDSQKIYIVTYDVNEDGGTGLKQLIRKERIFSAQEEVLEEKTKGFLPLVKDIRFEYAYRTDSASKEFEWQGFWDGETQNRLPSGIRISLEMDGSGDRYNKVIFLQQGNLGVR